MWPPGISGVSELAEFLEHRKRRNNIVDWHPGPWIDARRERIIIRFENQRDADHIEHQIAAGYETRERFLFELTLDPPSASSVDADAPLLDEDYLVLSTIHSAKGQEWDAVYILNVVDGCIPSDLATGSPEEIEEERRLLYVAMTRAKRHLHLIHALKMFHTQQQRLGDGHFFAPLTRFIPDSIRSYFAGEGLKRRLHPPVRCRMRHRLTSPNACAVCGSERSSPVPPEAERAGVSGAGRALLRSRGPYGSD